MPTAGHRSVGISHVSYRLPRSRKTLAALKRTKQVRSSVKFLSELGFTYSYLSQQAKGFDELLVGAAEEAMADSGHSPSQIGTLFLYSGLNSSAPAVGNAPVIERFRYPVAKLADRLKLPHANAMALSQQGCSGLLSAINLAARMVQAGDPPAALCVAGDAPHIARRISDFLKREVKSDLVAASRRAADTLGVTIKRVSIRDQSSRWGSCTSAGSLSFSWRLILAPPYVLDYLAAHEVAHLVEMNHSARFWRVVGKACGHVERAKAWLDTSGNDLHRYGIQD